METFEIESRGNCKMLYCRKRNLEIVVAERLDIPQYPEHAQLIFGKVKKRKLPGVRMTDDVVITFGIIDHEDICYEPFFRHLLITNAINDYAAREWHVKFDEVVYSPAYQKAFIDSMSLDPGKMSPALRGYMKRGSINERLDFDEWKAKYWDTRVN